MATWTSEEDAVLKTLYEIGSREEILSKLPGRLWKSIYKRSVILNLFRPKDDAWKKEEDELLKKLYADTPKDQLVTFFPGRTWKSISWRAVNVFRIVRTKDIVQEETRKTNRAHRGTDYPTQSAEVREKVKETVRGKYGVDNVFQAEEIKERMKETNLEKYGVENPNQSPEIRERSRLTNQELLGVDNPFQRVDLVKKGMMAKYGADSPQRVPNIRERTRQTNIQQYGFPTPAQNHLIRKKLIAIANSDEVRNKIYATQKEKGGLGRSEEEDKVYEYLKNIYPDAIHHKMHPVTKDVIDYYLPSQDLWVQYDGSYWHGLQKTDSEGPQKENIKRIMLSDQRQNEMIPNLIRFNSIEINDAKKTNSIDVFIKEFVEDKLEELKKFPQTCHQYRKKIQYYEEDIGQLPFNPGILKASDFDLSPEKLSDSIVSFIEKYEWLGTIGVSPKWCFTARFKGFLGGVVLINEPTAYSKILGEDTPKYEALIQRGASASWTPTNLGSRLIMFSCNWMVENTDKRVFVGYADLTAHERGIIYRACNFDYLGDDYGVSELLRHPDFKGLFTAHSLKRTSSFIKWCRENSITTDKNWFKENGFKNLETIPPGIKQTWYDWIQKIISESEHIKIEKKMKYALILGRNRRETRALQSLRKYLPKPYPDRARKSYHSTPETKRSFGKTANRNNKAKEQFLIDNYGKIKNIDMAVSMKESPRWVKRALARLTLEGKIVRLTYSHD